MTEPRVKFCWLCARKLRGNHFAEVEHGGRLLVFHKACAERVGKMHGHEVDALFKDRPIIF